MSGKLQDSLCNSYYVKRFPIKQYHFGSWVDNVYKQHMPEDYCSMFRAGSGKELKKAAAVYSSSMLSYNLFHWISSESTFKYGGTIYDKVVFEVKIPTILKSPAPANMDVVLVSKDRSKWLMIESKFTEYVHRSAREMLNLSRGYSDLDRYFFNAKSKSADIVRLIEEWYGEDKKSESEGEKKEKKKYYDGIKQLLCHIIAMKNLTDTSAHNAITKKFLSQNPFLRDEFYRLRTIEFITLLFDPLPKFKDENSAYEDYKSLCDDFKEKVEAGNIFSSFDVVPYSQMWNCMKGQIESGLSEYLKDRYMQFAGA